MSKIRLHIAQLSLPGYSPAERQAFLAALERELASGSGVAGNARSPHIVHRDDVRVTATDQRPQTVARQAVAGLKPGAKDGGRT
jgi:hypothetical protein